ncbi:MAG: polysaccharide pyruvyl transferase family protein [Flammeovirgaceae bacterium]|nr:MAG: polysaccharide pyruvyl transferase family protein [Flammeovirgaceae bacterium]
MKKILLQGYYGFGNLGDDILLLVCFRNIKKHFPETELVVFSNADAKTAAYLPEWLGEHVRTINYAAREHFDLIIHGGGGVHYDYENGGIFYFVLNRILRLQPSWLSKLFFWYKRIKGREHITAAKRIGLGIGLGTFTNSSKKFYENLVIMNSYDYLLVRDSFSLLLARKYKMRSQLLLSTDLAFYTDYWQPVKKANHNERKIGFVLRHWKGGNDYIDDAINVANNLAKDGFSITFFLFEAVHDLPCLQKLPNDYAVVKWPDDGANRGKFFDRFCEQSLVVSARFHGAILAATFQMPTIGIELDPKMRTLTEILPQSAQLIKKEDITTRLEQTVLNVYRKWPFWQARAKEDYEKNYKLIVSGVIAFNDFIRRENEAI